MHPVHLESIIKAISMDFMWNYDVGFFGMKIVLLTCPPLRRSCRRVDKPGKCGSDDDDDDDGVGLQHCNKV